MTWWHKHQQSTGRDLICQSWKNTSFASCVLCGCVEPQRVSYLYLHETVVHQLIHLDLMNIYIYIHTLSAIWPRSWYFCCIWSYGGSWGWRELSKTAIWSRLSEEPMRRKFSTQEAFSSNILEESTLRIVRSLCINLVHLLIVSLCLHMSELSLVAAMFGSWEASSILWQSAGALEHHQQKV